MLDIGFRPDIEKILRRCPQGRQTLLLSATIPPPVKRLAERYMRDPQMVDFSTKDLAVETIEQSYFTVDPERKFELLVKLLERENPQQAIVFCRTKRGTDKVCRRLSEKFKSVDTIHGDLQQSARDRVMRHFRDGRTKVLVATDVVGRGIDVTTISTSSTTIFRSSATITYTASAARAAWAARASPSRSSRRGGQRTDADRDADQSPVKARRDSRLRALAKPQPTGEIDAESDEPFEPPAPKPVFGRPVRRIRRAL